AIQTSYRTMLGLLGGAHTEYGAIVSLHDALPTFTAAMSAYLNWEARNLGMSKWQMTRMGGNVVVDTALGAIPFIGDLFDLAFRRSEGHTSELQSRENLVCRLRLE